MHQGKTQVWNLAGEKPFGCDDLERAAVIPDPTAIIWRGSDEVVRRGKVLGTPLGHPDFVKAHLDKLTAEHQTLLNKIPLVQDAQSAWLLLVHCAVARATSARVVEPESTEEFCRRHDRGLWRCYAQSSNSC